MKNPHRASEGAGNSRAAVKHSLADWNLCPHAPECRRHWLVDGQSEIADCAHCFQTLTRSYMARILAGRS